MHKKLKNWNVLFSLGNIFAFFILVSSATSNTTVTSSLTTSSSIPITLTPSKSSVRPSSSVPSTTGKPTTGKPTTGKPTPTTRPTVVDFNYTTHNGTLCVAVEGIILLTVKTGKEVGWFDQIMPILPF